MDQKIKIRQCLAEALLIGALLLTLLPQALSQEPERGDFLVATPALDGTAFEQTVILVIHHDENGSVGIMINRPTTLAPETILPNSRLSGYPGNVYFGGPVAPTRPLLLYRGMDALNSEGAVRVLRDVYLHTDAAGLTAAPSAAIGPARLRVYAGRAEWRSGQLEQELASGVWEVVSGTSAQVFSDRPLELWRLMRLSRNQEVVQLR